MGKIDLIEAIKEELDRLIEQYGNNPIFIRYMLILADIMDIIPLSFEEKQTILQILIYQGEIIKLERLNRTLNKHLYKCYTEDIGAKI
jgi:hypothetical protein